MVHGRPDKRAGLVDLVHASGTTIVSQGFVQVDRAGGAGPQLGGSMRLGRFCGRYCFTVLFNVWSIGRPSIDLYFSNFHFTLFGDKLLCFLCD